MRPRWEETPEGPGQRVLITRRRMQPGWGAGSQRSSSGGYLWQASVVNMSLSMDGYAQPVGNETYTLSSIRCEICKGVVFGGWFGVFGISGVRGEG